MSLLSKGKMRFKGYDIFHDFSNGKITFSKNGQLRYVLSRLTPYDNEIKRVCDMLEGDIVPKSRRLEDVRRADGSICKGETRY